MRLRTALVAALAVALTGCGSGPDTTTKSGKITISYAIWEKNDQASTQKIIDAFQKKHPDVTVKLEITPWDQYWTKLQTAATGGAAPDVFWMNSLNVRLYAKGGVIAPIENADVSAFPKAIVDGYRYDGKLYGMPRDVGIPMLWYDKELFDKAGVAYPTADWTWDDLRAAAKKLTDPARKQYGLLAPMWDQGGFYNTMIQAGGHVISADGKKSGFGEPGSIQGLEFWTDLINKDKVAPPAEVTTDTDPMQLFMTGKYAMYYGGSWFATAFKANTERGDKVDVAPLPKGPVQEGIILLGLANSVSAKSEHPAESAEFAAFISSDEAEKILSDSGGASVSSRAGTQDGWFKSFPNYHMKEAFDGSIPYGVPYPVSLNTAKWQDVQNKLLAEAWAGRRPAAEAAREIATRMNEILAEE
ncbi:ABC transporter substrate-binding protein [Nonomuraea zeae]|uniref:Sugar ABC transporter substrate-binding protein n=1 Tax=Nonomuraea zeae TaxID=1642303 RepID=A0A5S4GHR2_9ACTN|nr:sugar ABC transporter substrate-binding protein [Nonomuraea zeae]TMR32232.1 sugar ABC transporter substrate-binding protein [Nonomuraea zeae]